MYQFFCPGSLGLNNREVLPTIGGNAVAVAEVGRWDNFEKLEGLGI